MLRRVLWLVVGLAVVLAVAVWFDRSLDPINPGTFERIKEGMSKNDIEPALGMPSEWPIGSEWILPLQTEIKWLRRPVSSIYLHWGRWCGRNYRVYVAFDDHGVLGYSIKRLEDANLSIPDRIRAWLNGWN